MANRVDIAKQLIVHLCGQGYSIPADLKEWAGVELKADELTTKHRNIRGAAIPEAESSRGYGLTPKSVHTELELWRSNPVLAPYTPTRDEEKDLIAKWKL